MCEPNFSFCQIYHACEQQNRNNLLFGQEIRQSDLPATQIEEYLHFCKLGSGHTGAIAKASLQSGFRDEIKNDYEAKWWNREVKLDGWFRRSNGQEDFGGYFNSHHNKSGEEKDSFAAAEKYAHLACLGSLQRLRQFLTISFNKTNRLQFYVDRFSEFLNIGGRDKFFKQLYKMDISIPNNTPFGYLESLRGNVKINRKRNELTKLCLGYTRRRNLLVPEWADDSKLWEKVSKNN